MNVVNVEAVDAFCDALATLCGDVHAATWCRRNLRNHVVRDPALHVAVPSASSLPDLAARGLVEEVPDWLDRAFERGDDVVAFDASTPVVQAFLDACRRVVDWLRSDEGKAGAAGFAKLAVADAVAASDAWHDAMARRRVHAFAKRRGVNLRAAAAILASDDPEVANLWPDDPDGIEAVCGMGKGLYRMVRLRSQDALDREGTLLDHCVATYGAQVLKGETHVYSLRDARNMPLVTVEATPFARVAVRDAFLAPYLPPDFTVLRQAFSRRNGPVPEALRPYLRAFVARYAIGVPDRWAAEIGERREPGSDAYGRFLDVGLMADDLPTIVAGDPFPPRVRPGRLACRAFRILSERRDALGPGRESTALSLFLPDSGDVATEVESKEYLGRRFEVAVTTLPTGAFSHLASPWRDRDPDAVHASCQSVAREALARVAARPRASHRVAFSAPSLFPSTEAFFAYAGLATEWAAAMEASAAACRTDLREMTAAIKLALRKDGMDAAERDRLMNGLNVVVPSALSSLAPSREPKARPPARPAADETLRRLYARAGRDPPVRTAPIR